MTDEETPVEDEVEDPDATTCWQCGEPTTVYAISHDGLCPECSTARNREGDPAFNGAFDRW